MLEQQLLDFPAASRVPVAVSLSACWLGRHSFRLLNCSQPCPAHRLNCTFHEVVEDGDSQHYLGDVLCVELRPF